MSIDVVSNQSHKVAQKGYFEWWYFQFAFKQGRINLILHETDIFGLSQVPYISVSFFLNGGITRYYRRNLTPSEIISQGDGMYLKVLDGLFDEKEQSLGFQVHIDDLQFSGCIRKLVPPTMPENVILFKDNTYLQKNWWVVQIPYGEFNTKLKLNGVTYSLNGFVYQDHNWGTAPIYNHVKDWIWGHFSDNQGAITFSKIETLNGDLIDYVILVSRTKISTATNFNTSFLNEITNLVKPEKINSDISLTFPEHAGEFTFNLSQRDLMRKRLSESYAGFFATYCRWSAFGELNILGEKRALRGIAEYLRIRRSGP